MGLSALSRVMETKRSGGTLTGRLDGGQDEITKLDNTVWGLPFSTLILENIFNRSPEQTSDFESQRQGRVIFSILDGVDGIP